MREERGGDTADGRNTLKGFERSSMKFRFLLSLALDRVLTRPEHCAFTSEPISSIAG